MDLITGISALSAAVGIAKDLRELDRGIDEAEYKLKLADLVEALADAKIALSDSNIELNKQSMEIERLRNELDSALNGDICPKCKDGRLKLSDTRRMSEGGLGRYGVENHTFSCDSESCDHETKIVHDPQGLVPKWISKR